MAQQLLTFCDFSKQDYPFANIDSKVGYFNLKKLSWRQTQNELDQIHL
jgi:hypothetical protein